MMSEGRRQHSVGVVGWVRRRILPQLSRLSAVLGLLVLGVWIAGRVYTDEHRWSQYLWWTPPIWAIGTAWVLLIVSALLAIPARRSGGLFARPLLLLLCLGSTGFLVFGMWRLHRAIVGETIPEDAVRVVHWNQSAAKVDAEAWGERIEAMGADIVLIANASWGERRQTMLEQFEYFAPLDQERWVNYSYRIDAEPAHYRVEGNALVASRYPMTRTGMVRFGSAQRQEVLDHSASGHGWVMFIEFDLDPQGPVDEPLVVWFVDLPSDPFRWKQEQMHEIRAAIENWDGRGWVMGRSVWEQFQAPDAAFPEPDLIIGDFNTPRRSASLEILAPGFADAFAEAGWGRGRSWEPPVGGGWLTGPFKLADWHIDLTLIGPGWEPVRYELVDPRRGFHRMQVVDVVPVAE